MPITLDRLTQHCQQPLKPFYVVTGDELYLTDQAVKTLCNAAKQQHFSEKQIFYIDNVKDWGPTWQAIHTQSLFAEKRIVVIRTTLKALSKTTHQQIIDYCQQPDINTLIIMVLPKLKSNQLSQAWLKAIEKIGEIVTAWPISRSQLPSWISQRCRQYGMNITPSACQWLCDQIEGDAGLAAQEVEKLYCLYGLPAKSKNQTITLNETHLRDYVVDAARFDVYTLTDSCLTGDIKRSLRIVAALKAEGCELTFINWAIPRMLRQLIMLHQAGPSHFAKTCQQQGIWQKQQPLFQQALQRLSLADCLACLQSCQQLDECIKGICKQNPWQRLQLICANLCGLSIIKDSDAK